MSEERILERVRKMLALAADVAATEGERENALRMAHNLLAKHNLDLADVDEFTRQKDDPRGAYETEGWSLNWAKQVYQIVGRLFFCKYYYGRKVNGTRCKHTFVGRESNATTAMWMAAYVVDSILKEARGLYKHNLDPRSRSFAMGATDRLYDRVAEMQKTAESTMVSECRAVALVDVAKAEADANELFIKEAGTKLVANKPRASSINGDAYRSGHEYGGKISLNTQIKGSPDPKQLR